MSENDTLSRNQRRALAALLKTRTILAASEECGLGEKTIYRYLSFDTFRQALAQAEGRVIEEAGRRLVTGQDKALETLESMLEDAEVSSSNRRLAAVAWLDLTLRWREVKNVEERLKALEEVAFGKAN